MLEQLRGSCDKLINKYAYTNKFFTGDSITDHQVITPSNLSDEAYGSFYGAIMPSYGNNVVFIPKQHPHIGLYSCSTDTYTNGPLHSAGVNAFHNGVDLGNSEILMCPYQSSRIGLYNYGTNIYRNGPIVTSSSRSDDTLGRFIACVKIGQKVYLIPAGCNNIGIYDIPTNTFQIGAEITSSEGDNKFASAVQISDTEILLVPYSNYNFYRYNFVADTIVEDIETNRTINYFGPSIKYKDVVICSTNNGGFLVYDTITKTIASYVGDKSYAYNNPFSELILYGKKIVCVPKRSSYVGEYEYATNTYSRGNNRNQILTDVNYKNFYAGGCLVANRIIMAPYHATNVGIYKPDSFSGE